MYVAAPAISAARGTPLPWWQPISTLNAEVLVNSPLLIWSASSAAGCPKETRRPHLQWAFVSGLSVEPRSLPSIPVKHLRRSTKPGFRAMS